ncbi:hypothetical protein Q7L73_22615, partial [Conexibacter sp. CPCC 205762]
AAAPPASRRPRPAAPPARADAHRATAPPPARAPCVVGQDCGVESDPFHDFFLASAGAAGALIGLRFVVGSLLPLLNQPGPVSGGLRDGRFLVSRAWELIGGPTVTLRGELQKLLRARR